MEFQAMTFDLRGIDRVGRAYHYAESLRSALPNSTDSSFMLEPALDGWRVGHLLHWKTSGPCRVPSLGAVRSFALSPSVVGPCRDHVETLVAEMAEDEVMALAA